MLLRWEDLGSGIADTAAGQTLTLSGFPVALPGQDHAVIGVWPPASVFPTLGAMAAGIARMVDAVGVDHVGLGTDMRGLVGPSVLPDYDRLPALAEALLQVGFSPDGTAKILGGNYRRVFEACMV